MIFVDENEFQSEREYLIEKTKKSLKISSIIFDANFLISIAVDSVLHVIGDERSLNSKKIKVIKAIGLTMDHSRLVDGIVLPEGAHLTRRSTTKRIDAKIGLIQFCISPPRGDMMNGGIIIDYDSIDRIFKEERQFILKICKVIKKSGCNLLFVQKSILRDDLDSIAIHLLSKLKIMVVRGIDRRDVPFLSETLNIQPIKSTDEFTSEKMGFAELVEEKRIGRKKTIEISGIHNQGSTATCILTSMNQIFLDELEKYFYESLRLICSSLRVSRVLFGDVQNSKITENMVSLSQLPNELIIEIFIFLNHISVLSNMNLVNSRFYDLVESEYMYEAIYFPRFFPELFTEMKKVEEILEWKKYVREKVFERNQITFSIHGEKTKRSFTTQRNLPFEPIFTFFSKQLDVSLRRINFEYDFREIGKFQTPREIGLENDDRIGAFLRDLPTVNPIILMYPPHDDFKVEKVKVTLTNQFWNINEFFPVTKIRETNSTTIIEWENLSVQKDGKIKQLSSSINPTQDYLFWESIYTKDKEVPEFNPSVPIFVVESSNVSKFLINLLIRMGLEKENIQNSWLEKIRRNNKYVLFQFMNMTDFEAMVSTEIFPPPEVILKIFILYIGFRSLDEINQKKKENVIITHFDENGKVTNKEGNLVPEKCVRYGEEFVVVQFGLLDIVDSDWIALTYMNY